MSLPRFLADEDLRYEIVLATRRLNPEIVFLTVRERGLGGTPDPELLAYAAADGLLLVSHDVNTMRAAAGARLASEMNGLFLVAQTRATRAVAESLVLIWSASDAEEWSGRIIYLPLELLLHGQSGKETGLDSLHPCAFA